MSPKRIAVITPCYNHAHYLSEAVASVLTQTHTNWELIIVDDGSADNTHEISQMIIAHYPQQDIRVIHQENQGLPASRNNAIALTDSEYIFTLDADDKIEPETLAMTATVLDCRPEVGFVYPDRRLFGSEQGVVQNREFDRELMRIDCYLQAAALFRRQAWEQVGGYDRSLRRGFEDWDFWIRLVQAGWSGARLALPLLNYRRQESSKVSAGRKLDLELRAQIIQNHPGLYEPGFHRWAERVLSPEWSQNGVLHSYYWPLAHVLFCGLIARYAPRELPRLALRPLFWRLPMPTQTVTRHVGRSLVGYSRKR